MSEKELMQFPFNNCMREQIFLFLEKLLSKH